MNNLSLYARFANKGFFSLFFTGLVKVASLLKVSFIFGSYTAFFSMTSIMIPLSGAFGSFWGALGVCGLGLGLRILLGSVLTLKFLAYHIPGFFAAWYWSSRSLVIQLLVPAICIALFIVHPTGYQVWAYSMFWLIPMAIYAMKKNNLFLQALGSTFIAHAVGTVIWIYAVPTCPEFWLMLAPIVIIERLVFASGMVVMHKILTCCFKTFEQRFVIFRLIFHANRSF